MSEQIAPRVKICGVTSLADARLVVEVGADALGLVYASSVRQVSDDVATAIVERYAEDIWCVGVFRHQEESEILRIVERDGLRAVQLHDPASREFLDDLRARGVSVLRAVTASSPQLTRGERRDVVAVLVDGAQPGSGVANDWDLVTTLRFEIPVVVAGGLRADTVAGVIERVAPWGVDVASGVELSPGVKDPDEVASFVSRARAALSQKGPQ